MKTISYDLLLSSDMIIKTGIFLYTKLSFRFYLWLFNEQDLLIIVLFELHQTEYKTNKFKLSVYPTRETCCFLLTQNETFLIFIQNHELDDKVFV